MFSYDPPGCTKTNRSMWQQAAPAEWPTLTQDALCDVCVVGAGISGLSVAYELARRGKDVILLEADAVGAGETSRSTAHLVTSLDERYYLLERRYGVDTIRQAAASHVRAIEWIRETIERENIECAFARVEGTLVVPRERSAEAPRLLDLEEQAALRAGLKPARRSVPDSMTEWFPHGALVFPDQAQVDPVRLLDGLAGALARRGARLFEHARVVSLEPGRRCHQLRTQGGPVVRATAVVLATHDIPECMRLRVRAVESTISFVTTYEVQAGREVEALSLLWDGYWDREVPYHYVRWARVGDERLLVVGGQDQAGDRPTTPHAAYTALSEWTRVHLPFAENRRHGWWGRILEPKGEFALIGHVPDVRDVYLVAGDSGNGMTYAAVAAERIAGLISSERRPAIEDRLFDPAR